MKLLLLFASLISGCQCNDAEYGFTVGEKLPPYPDTVLVEDSPSVVKYKVEKTEPCGVVHQYFVTTTRDKIVTAVWRKW